MTLSPRVARLRASNPSPMTLDGTNGYVVDGGAGGWVAIDPGPADPAAVAAFVAAAAAAGARFEAILVTHGHPDHYPAAALLAHATGAPVIAHRAARFAHDRALADGERLAAGSAVLRAIEAPGHAPDHLIFVLEDEAALFTGDVILGRGTVLIAPPDGDMRAYQRTLRRLRDEEGDSRAIYGGHGPEIRTPRATIEAYLAHREAREAEILTCLATGPQTIPALVTAIYRDVGTHLWPAAGRQVLAYLIALAAEGRVLAAPLARPPDAAERAILEIDYRGLGDDRARAVAAAELGAAGAVPLAAYALTS